jgi:hypothetical protein
MSISMKNKMSVVAAPPEHETARLGWVARLKLQAELLLADVICWVMALWAEFLGAADLVKAKLRTVRKTLRSEPVRKGWAVMAAGIGLVFVLTQTPIYLSLYILLTSGYLFLDALLDVLCLCSAPAVLVYTRLEASYRWCQRKNIEYRSRLNAWLVSRKSNPIRSTPDNVPAELAEDDSPVRVD